jgi:hypothetical protein
MDAIKESAPPADLSVYCNRWTDMWNCLLPASDVVATDCRVYFGRQPQTPRPTTTTGPHELQGVIDAIRQRLPGIHYRVDSSPCYQADSNTSGIITLLWNVAVPDQGIRTGIDLLRYEAAQITEVWSITGDLELPCMR